MEPQTNTTIEAAGRGGQIKYDGQFVTISRKGFLARATVGKGDKRIPVKSITSVQWKPAGPLVNGFIQFSMGGGNERRSRLGSNTADASKDENSVVFMRSQQPAFEEIRNAIEAGIVGGGTVSGPADSLDQLKKLGELRDAGILTESEFNAKKAQILGT